jgi:hypothetical protein
VCVCVRERERESHTVLDARPPHQAACDCPCAPRHVTSHVCATSMQPHARRAKRKRERMVEIEIGRAQLLRLHDHHTTPMRLHRRCMQVNSADCNVDAALARPPLGPMRFMARSLARYRRSPISRAVHSLSWLSRLTCLLS